MKAGIKVQFIYEDAATRAADFEIQVDRFFPAATLHFIVARKILPLGSFFWFDSVGNGTGGRAFGFQFEYDGSNLA